MSSILALLVVAAGPNIAWRMDFTPTYTDNLFEYSPSDIDSFVHRVNPARFPIRSSDDLDANIGLACAVRYRLADRPGSAGLRARLHGYASNWEKSYALAAIEVEQAVWPGGEAALSFLYMPDYLIRYYRPHAGSEYEPCRFAEQLLTASVRQRLGSFDVAGIVRWEIDDYSRVFDYYDTRAWRAGPRLSWRLRDNLKADVSYEFKAATAAGPVPDISYRQHEAGIDVETRPMQFSRFSVGAFFDFARREFTTANSTSVDPAHAGRVDNIERAGVELRYRQGSATLVLGYEAEWRSVVSATTFEVDEVKEYRKNSIKLGVALSARTAR
jgi:hypothetical protein